MFTTMSKPRKVKYSCIRCEYVEDLVFELSSCNSKLYESIIRVFKRYLNHFYVDISFSINSVDLAKELIYWNVSSIGYCIETQSVTMLKFNTFFPILPYPFYGSF